MGIPFSNSEEMAQIFAVRMKEPDAELIPAVTSEGVVKELLEDSADLGVLAVRNSSAGPVIETEKALEGLDYRIVSEGDLHIHHCVFTKKPDSEITSVSSHIQALEQCRASLSKLYPGAEPKECSDTAYAAEMLAEGLLPETCAVLCKRSAGEHYGLYPAHENIEDADDNTTHFWLITIRRAAL